MTRPSTTTTTTARAMVLRARVVSEGTKAATTTTVMETTITTTTTMMTTTKTQTTGPARDQARSTAQPEAMERDKAQMASDSRQELEPAVVATAAATSWVASSVCQALWLVEF